MPITNTLKQQFKQNLLAVISLVIAILALSYNSWRNEQSEDNRNVREAGFEIMRESAYLQLFVDTATYAEQPESQDAIQGWVRVNLVISLSDLMSPEVNQQALHLKQVWSENWSSVFTNKQANQNITEANVQLVDAVKTHLSQLR